MLNKSENNTSPHTENNDATNEITTCGSNPQLSPGRNISIVIRPLPALIIAVMLAVGIIGSIICYNYVSLNVLVSGIFLCVAFFLFYAMSKKGYINSLPFKIMLIGFCVETIALLTMEFVLTFVTVPGLRESSTLFNIATFADAATQNSSCFGLTNESLTALIFITTTPLWISPVMIVSLISILKTYKTPSRRVICVTAASVLCAIMGALLIICLIVSLILVSDYCNCLYTAGLAVNTSDPAYPVYAFFNGFISNYFFNLIFTGFFIAAYFYLAKSLSKIRDACQYTSVINITEAQSKSE